MNPRGPIPHAIALVDDQLFGAQCCADCTQGIVQHIKEDLAYFWRDRTIDLGEARHLGADLERLDKLCREECGVLTSIREGLNKVTELVRYLRARLQQSKGERT